MTTYIVTFSRAHHLNREIGRFGTYGDAVAAAVKNGAVGIPTSDHGTFCYAVEDHEDDDDYAIWIEPSE